MTDRHSISVVVPTYDRPAQLERCIESIAAQTVLPEDVVVVDDGDRPATDALGGMLPSSVELTVTSSRGLPGSGTARNTGAELARGDVVLFVDDDMVLDETYLERLEELYRTHDSPSLAGIGGYDERMVSEQSWLGALHDVLFYLGHRGWEINEAGMPNARPVAEPTRADWLLGNNMSFKRELVLDHPFPQWRRGREPHEDLAVGWALKRDGYHCLVDPELSFVHEESAHEETSFRTAVRMGRNRIRLFRRYGRRRYAPLLAWALVGEVTRQFLEPLLNGHWTDYWTRGAGVALGSLQQLLALGESGDG